MNNDLSVPRELKKSQEKLESVLRVHLQEEISRITLQKSLRYWYIMKFRNDTDAY